MTALDPLKQIIEDAIAAERFNMRALFQRVGAAIYGSQSAEVVGEVAELLGRKAADHVLQGILRSSLLIELVKTPKIETTKYETRWAPRLGSSDPRYATFETCLDIFSACVEGLLVALTQPEQRETLQLFATHPSVPYELPIDYVERRTDSSMHTPENVSWVWQEAVQNTVRLRALLQDKSNPYAPFFAVAYKKIRVKTYLTDRVLTGAHKTNREKRWETHPGSVHFALRRSCLEIERTLVSQLCHFAHCPPQLTAMLEDAGLLVPFQTPFRCPITLDPLSFEEFEREVNDPTWGEASFQVGHLNPLKGVSDDPRVGHTAQNISWVSFHGNRIQGRLSLHETRALLRRIYENYAQAGGI